jgi:hypothetical protein
MASNNDDAERLKESIERIRATYEAGRLEKQKRQIKLICPDAIKRAKKAAASYRPKPPAAAAAATAVDDETEDQDLGLAPPPASQNTPLPPKPSPKDGRTSLERLKKRMKELGRKPHAVKMMQ